MGCHDNITAATFPKQGRYLHARCKVMFHFDGPSLMGTMVRDDMEEPFIAIIKLDDGRYVLTNECQYSPQIQRDKVEETERIK